MIATLRWLTAMIALTPMVACGDGCNDDYNPTNRDSCSYNPELVGLVESRDALVGEVGVPEEIGEGNVYLLVTPQRPGRGDDLEATLVNFSNVAVGYDDGYELLDYRRHPKATECPAHDRELVLEPDQESAPQEVVPCESGTFRPGDYDLSKEIVLDPEGEALRLDIEVGVLISQ